MSWGRYNAANTFTYAEWFNPVSYQRENRNWVDCASLDGRACLTQTDLMAMGLDPAIAFGGSAANAHTVGVEGTVWNGGTNGDGFAQDWEIGPPLRANFGGLASRPVEHPDGVERNWVSVLNVGVQRELFEGFSASFNWYRRDTYDSVLRVNRAWGSTTTPGSSWTIRAPRIRTAGSSRATRAAASCRGRSACSI